MNYQLSPGLFDYRCHHHRSYDGQALSCRHSIDGRCCGCRCRRDFRGSNRYHDFHDWNHRRDLAGRHRHCHCYGCRYRCCGCRCPSYGCRCRYCGSVHSERWARARSAVESWVAENWAGPAAGSTARAGSSLALCPDLSQLWRTRKGIQRRRSKILVP